MCLEGPAWALRFLFALGAFDSGDGERTMGDVEGPSRRLERVDGWFKIVEAEMGSSGGVYGKVVSLGDMDCSGSEGLMGKSGG